jgi:hypothetical protein
MEKRQWTRRMINSDMPRPQTVGVVSLALILLSTPSYAADKIVLSCSAVSVNEDTGERLPNGTKSVILDLAQGLVTMDLGTLAITQVGQNDVSFESRAWSGQINRISWSGFIAPRGHVAGNVKVELTCKQATP